MQLAKRRLAVLNNLVHHYGPQHWWEDENKIYVLVTMILIQRTTSQNVEKAIQNLEGSLSVAALVKMDLADLTEKVRPAGFYKQKARYIKNIMQWLADHGGHITNFQNVETAILRDEILNIKGVGEETADVMLLYVFERDVFVADAYARRLFGRLGLGDYADYASMRADFQPLVTGVDHQIVKEWHAVIDEHGKQFRHDAKMDESWLLIG